MAGVMEMENRVAVVIVRTVFPERPPKVAVMVEVPAATAVARPVLLTDADDVLDDLQMTWVVKSWLAPSEYVPVAVNCLVIPAGMLGLAGVTAIETRAAVGAPLLPPPPLPPHPANSARAKIIKRILLDFVNAHSRRD